ncbi:MAG: hypothetical protein ACOYM2_01770 [Rectinemataceae bacterium]
MGDEAAVFRMDLGTFDLLLPASDFCGLAVLPGSGDIPARADFKGRKYELLLLDPALEGLFGLEPCAAGSEAVAFLAAGRDESPRAFVSRRAFEIGAVPLRDFRLPPSGLKASLARRGLLAFRFGRGPRFQILLDPGALTSGVRGEKGAGS